MRFTLLLIMVAISGCSQSSPPPAAFKPEFFVKWPGEPTEEIHIYQDTSGGEKEYSANWTNKRPEGVLFLSIHVTEYPKQFLDGLSSEKYLEAYLTGFKDREIIRNKLVHGSQKYPGFDVTTRFDKSYDRRIVILADRCLYDVSAHCKKKEWLSEPEVISFFDSLDIK